MDIPESIRKADETLRRELKKIRYTELSDYFHCENQEDLIRAINESSLDEIMEKLVNLKNDIVGLNVALTIETQNSINRGTYTAFNAPEAVASMTDLMDRKEMLYEKLNSIPEISLLFSIYSRKVMNTNTIKAVTPDIQELIEAINYTHNNNPAYYDITGDMAPGIFTSGNCYYYAELLQKFYPEGELVFYNLDDRPHIAFRLNGEVYDSTGRKSKEEAKEFHPIEGEDWTWVEHAVLPKDKKDRDAMEQFVNEIYNDIVEQYYPKDPEVRKGPKA